MLKKKNSYIISLEGKDIINYQKINKNKGFITYNNKKLFKGSLDYSLEAIRINELNDKVFYLDEDKQYTKAVVNVTFTYKNNDEYRYVNLSQENNNFKSNEIIGVSVKRKNGKNEGKIKKYLKYKSEAMSTQEIREHLYKNGFRLDGREYIRFKRSGGASRVGKCLFIRKDLYKDMMKWSYMGLEFGKNDKMDLASMEAYISLTTSSIIDTINIDPKGILMIDDYNSVFKDKVMATRLNEKNELITKTEDIEISNSIWDGQSLLDESVFGEKYRNKGFLLLRNRFLKSACFNCNIQKFFKDNNITNICQLNGVTKASKIEDIKLITTPSSIKFLKMAKSHPKFKRFENLKEEAFKYWVDNIDSTFGIVKYEKPPHNLNKMVQTHYQLINTLNLTKDEVRKLLKPSLDYISLLKNDLSVFRYHIGINQDKCDEENNDYDFLDSSKMIYNLLMINDKFAETRLFYNFKQEIIKSYKNNLRKGHVLVNGNYSVLCGNGYEMLKATIKDKSHESYFDGNSILGIDEVHSKAFRWNTKLLGVRSPHVTMGNLWVNTNVKNKELDTYFNSSKYIVHVNSINNNLLERLSSADFDSDQVLLTDNEILVNSAVNIYGKFLVPTDFTPKEATIRTNCTKDKIDLDIKTSKNLIGEIVNLSQILNSEYWDRLHNNKSVDNLYPLISQLDVLSCIEIDKAKKESPVDSDYELKKIRKSEFISYDKIIRNKNKKNVMCRPYFFKFVGEGKNYKFKKKDTPMDYLEEIIDCEIPNAKPKKFDLNMTELLVNNIECKNNKKQCKKIIDLVNILNNETAAIYSSSLNHEDKYKNIIILREELVNKLKKMKINDGTMINIIKRINKDYKNENNGDMRSIGRLILNLLYMAHPDIFKNIFEKNKKDICIVETLGNIGNNNEIITIYNKKFMKKIV